MRATAVRAVEAIFVLQSRIGIPQRLRDTGIDRAALPQIARDTMQEQDLCFNPKRVENPEVVLSLLEEAW